ncbi:MAG: DUF4923 family protein [Muribaculaceae bacterium]|nr:DUF4923 family protein [Muribaculaceae bacterium]
MKFKSILSIALFAIVSFLPATTYAFDLKDLLGGGSDVVSGIIDGVLTRSNIDVRDLSGQWTVSGSAVSFKSENLLAKAGGMAASAAIENKIDGYYKKYGLTGGTFVIQEDGNFSMKVKGVSLNGSIEKKGDDGTFEFNFKVLGMKLTSLTAYVEKSPSALKIMFDATKLKSLLQTLAKLSGNSLTQTAVSILDNYDGLCVGFSLSQTGSAPAVPSILNPAETGSDNGSDAVSPGSSSTTSSDSTSTSKGSGLGSLLDVLKKLPTKK